jgi:uncharacterized protein
MSPAGNPVYDAIYVGEIVHKRLKPLTHAFAYRVFSLLVDCDELPALSRRLRLFSYNRFNLISLFDRDHGDGSPLGPYLHALAAQSPAGAQVRRFMMLAYPRVLGYAFNPLTVYFGLDENDRVRLTVYEVHNTFGERKSYVLPVASDAGALIHQSCRKRFYVSPFNSDTGNYSFHVTAPGESLTVGVALRDAGGPLLRAHFRGSRETLTDTGLFSALARTGALSLKVIAAIHYEAVKLWLKGLRAVPRPPAPQTPVSFIDAPREAHRS